MQSVVRSCRQIGATAVLLTPVVMTGEGGGPMGQAPMSFFAPNPALAVGQSPLAASQELKHVIKQLHAHGIEVILQVIMHELCERFALVRIQGAITQGIVVKKIECLMVLFPGLMIKLQ